MVASNVGEQYTKIEFYSDKKCVLMKLANYARIYMFQINCTIFFGEP